MTRPPPATTTPRRACCGCGWFPGMSPRYVALLVLLAVLAFGTNWYARLFGFLKDVCIGECPPAPFGVDFYIYPLVWGGIGAAVAAALRRAAGVAAEGLVSVLLAALAIVLVLFASAAGTALTDFSCHVLAQRIPRASTRPSESEITTARTVLRLLALGDHRSVTVRQKIPLRSP